MNKLKPFLAKSALLKIYYAIIHPYLIYACQVGAIQPICPTYMSKLCILQNKAIKLTCDGKKSDHVRANYSKIKQIKTSRFIQT